MLNNKRGQVGETITWAVATVIIIVVLIVSVFISSAAGNNSKKLSIIDEKRDFIMAKSVVNFLNENSDILKKAVKEKNYNGFRNKLETFLEGLSSRKRSLDRGWNIEFVNVDSGEKFRVVKSSSRYVNKNSFFDMDLKINFEEIKLYIWEECFEKC